MSNGEETQKNKYSREMRAIKTYRDFAISSLKEGGSTSLAKMIIQDKKKQEIRQSQAKVKKKNIFMIFLSIFLVGLGIVAITGIFLFSIQNKDDPAKTFSVNLSSFIPYDYQKEVDLTNMNHRKLEKVFVELVDDTKIPIGDVKILYFTKQNEQGVKELASARDFITTLDTRIPIQLERTLYKTFSAGIVTIDSNLPFLIFKVHSFDTAYVRTREWEKSILFDLGLMLGVNRRFYSQPFVDLNLYNEDTRVILDEEGKVVFGYSFIKMNILIFFTSNDTFKHFKIDLQSYQERI